ncbi:unnamed protein product, partial [Protopolystoma xenopodis]
MPRPNQTQGDRRMPIRPIHTISGSSLSPASPGLTTTVCQLAYNPVGHNSPRTAGVNRGIFFCPGRPTRHPLSRASDSPIVGRHSRLHTESQVHRSVSGPPRDTDRQADLVWTRVSTERLLHSAGPRVIADRRRHEGISGQMFGELGVYLGLVTGHAHNKWMGVENGIF